MVSDSGSVVPRGKNYAPNEWYVTVRLSDFFNSRIETMETDYGEEEGIFIPFEHSGIKRTSRNNVMITFKALLGERATERYTHVLTPMMDIEDYAYWKQLGFKIPFMGHMRPSNFKNKYK